MIFVTRIRIPDTAGQIDVVPNVFRITQGWGAGACRSRVFLASWSRSRSSLKKKSGAGAAKNLAGSSALREDKKHKEIVL